MKHPLRLASLFQDHAVLQRDMDLPLWGWGQPMARMRATLAGHEARACANESGRFEFRLPALPAGGPHILRVENETSGESVEVTDILIGEVWIASGQSNMEWSMQACGDRVARDIASADFPSLRFFQVGKRALLGSHEGVSGEWKCVSPESVADCSAVAYSFGRSLQRELNLPIGLIVSAYGGTIIESWTSRMGLMRNPESMARCLDYDRRNHSPEAWEDAGTSQPTGSTFPEDPGNVGFGAGWALPEWDDTDWPMMELPNTWQSQGYSHSGVLWFRKRVSIPMHWKGKPLRLELGAIDKQDITYVNGREVGRTGKGLEMDHYLVERKYPVPGELAAELDGEIVIAVRVCSFAYDGGLTGPTAAMCLHPVDAEDERIPLSGEWRVAVEHDYGHVETSYLVGPDQPNSPHRLFDNMIAPLIPYAIRGGLWYQGESNAVLGFGYRRYLEALIFDWRYLWGQGEFPFHIVQLPNYLGLEPYQEHSSWAKLRQAQMETLNVPNTGMAITLDLGEADDLHPANKMPVGERLALSVLVDVYGLSGSPCGPLLKSWSIEDGRIICEFHHVENGLSTLDGAQPCGIFIAGEDRLFLEADASIHVGRLVCSHPDIATPRAVRYAWANNPARFNLCNASGQLASPFRTDDW
ncbi:MAG: sialate O-acetylesterase [Puniceicoccaceae bacterium]